MSELPKIRSHNSTDRGFTTYFDDTLEHRLEAGYMDVDGTVRPRQFTLFRANRAVAHFDVSQYGHIAFSWNHASYTADAIRPFLASIFHHRTRVDFTSLYFAAKPD